jgi:hypothetical protein
MPPNAQIRTFGILLEKGQDYLAVVLRGWLNKEKRMCRILRILYFLFLKIYSRPCTKKIVKQDYLKVVLKGVA